MFTGIKQGQPSFHILYPDAFLADKLMAKCPSKFEGQGQAASGDPAARRS